jgi:hypothetical protein
MWLRWKRNRAAKPNVAVGHVFSCVILSGIIKPMDRRDSERTGRLVYTDVWGLIASGRMRCSVRRLQQLLYNLPSTPIGGSVLLVYGISDDGMIRLTDKR